MYKNTNPYFSEDLNNFISGSLNRRNSVGTIQSEGDKRKEVFQGGIGTQYEGESQGKHPFMIPESMLDDMQIDLMNRSLNRSMVISGCAGSGKSVIALYKAKQIKAQYPDAKFHVVVYTKALKQYMSDGCKDLGIDTSNCYFHFYEWRRQFQNEINSRSCFLDFLIVDEIQDFTQEEIEIFFRSAKKVFLFGDTAQSVYKQFRPTMSIDSVVNYAKNILNIQVKTANLINNYRLPIPVARISENYFKFESKYNEENYKSEENVKPHVIGYRSDFDEYEAIARIVGKINSNSIGILVSNNSQAKIIFEKLKKLGINAEAKFQIRKPDADNILANGGTYEDAYNEFFSLNFHSSNPKIMTYHSAKGLQFETVIITYAGNNYRDFSNMVIYVAMTRTYRNLYLLYSGNIPFPLNKVDPSLYISSEQEQKGMFDF